ncbi:MAG: aminotransferase class III-fold pyridoxal phosphate-dependent enzyme, partial [Calditrichaeota bacterium]|nr:aminotransferase class III-fold pyridoxal phosphate-dependent enzyme [Calditrichota bacterium]
MKLFDVYPRYNIAPVRGEDVFVWDDAGNRYLDLYGGHAVISIGHSHPDYVRRISEQLNQLGFYSNSVNMPIQDALAAKLGELSGYPEYNLFLTNSGAESIENALKLASFFNGRKKVVAFGGAFHGRTAAAVAVTDNPKIRAPFNETEQVIFLKLNDADAVQNALQSNDIAAVIVEGIQGVGGIQVAENNFLQNIRRCCDETGTL